MVHLSHVHDDYNMCLCIDLHGTCWRQLSTTQYARTDICTLSLNHQRPMNICCHTIPLGHLRTHWPLLGAQEPSESTLSATYSSHELGLLLWRQSLQPVCIETRRQEALVVSQHLAAEDKPGKPAARWGIARPPNVVFPSEKSCRFFVSFVVGFL